MSSSGKHGSRRHPSQGSRSGFTLLELLLAILIISIVAGVLIDQRIGIVRDTARIRSQRVAWELASRQMSAIELDKTLFKEETSGFDKFQDYPGFTYEYKIEKEEVETNDPEDPNQKPKEIMKLTLTIKIPDAESEEDHISLVSYQPIYDEPQQQQQPPPQGQ